MTFLKKRKYCMVVGVDQFPALKAMTSSDESCGEEGALDGGVSPRDTASDDEPLLGPKPAPLPLPLPPDHSVPKAKGKGEEGEKDATQTWPTMLQSELLNLRLKKTVRLHLTKDQARDFSLVELIEMQSCANRPLINGDEEAEGCSTTGKWLEQLLVKYQEEASEGEYKRKKKKNNEPNEDDYDVNDPWIDDADVHDDLDQTGTKYGGFYISAGDVEDASSTEEEDGVEGDSTSDDNFQHLLVHAPVKHKAPLTLARKKKENEGSNTTPIKKLKKHSKGLKITMNAKTLPSSGKPMVAERKDMHVFKSKPLDENAKVTKKVRHTLKVQGDNQPITHRKQEKKSKDDVESEKAIVKVKKRKHDLEPMKVKKAKKHRVAPEPVQSTASPEASNDVSNEVNVTSEQPKGRARLFLAANAVTVPGGIPFNLAKASTPTTPSPTKPSLVTTTSLSSSLLPPAARIHVDSPITDDDMPLLLLSLAKPSQPICTKSTDFKPSTVIDVKAEPSIVVPDIGPVKKKQSRLAQCASDTESKKKTKKQKHNATEPIEGPCKAPSMDKRVVSDHEREVEGNIDVLFENKTEAVTNLKEWLQSHNGNQPLNEEGHAIVHVVAQLGKEYGPLLSQLAEVLNSHGVDMNATDKLGNTGLHVVLLREHVQLNALKALLPYIDTNIPNKVGDTVLHQSVRRLKLTTTKRIVDQGGDPSVKNNVGMTPFDIALEKGNTPEGQEMVKMLFNVVNNLRYTIPSSTSSAASGSLSTLPQKTGNKDVDSGPSDPSTSEQGNRDLPVRKKKLRRRNPFSFDVSQESLAMLTHIKKIAPKANRGVLSLGMVKVLVDLDESLDALKNRQKHEVYGTLAAYTDVPKATIASQATQARFEKYLLKAVETLKTTAELCDLPVRNENGEMILASELRTCIESMIELKQTALMRVKGRKDPAKVLDALNLYLAE
eukprot:Ihof_evm3s20 gene=Ihof_evmTU3s20